MPSVSLFNLLWVGQGEMIYQAYLENIIEAELATSTLQSLKIFNSDMSYEVIFD